MVKVHVNKLDDDLVCVKHTRSSSNLSPLGLEPRMIKNQRGRCENTLFCKNTRNDALTLGSKTRANNLHVTLNTLI